ncbi:hypothetical protein Bca101_045358 [Brassica carinata]
MLSCFQVLSMCSESVPVFNNLKSLTIKSDKDRGWQAMPALLRNCPHLETIVIQGLVHRVTDKCGDVCDCISREDKGLSLKLCPVKVMKIHGLGWCHTNHNRILHTGHIFVDNGQMIHRKFVGIY